MLRVSLGFAPKTLGSDLRCCNATIPDAGEQKSITAGRRFDLRFPVSKRLPVICGFDCLQVTTSGGLRVAAFCLT